MSESSLESNPESSSGVYKSKLFNFLNRRSQELLHQSKTVLRHLQVATTWGVQIAIYPVYLLIQTSRKFVWQLQESAAKKEANSLGNQVDSQSLLPSADQPITQVLELAKSFSPLSFSQTPILEASQLGNIGNNSLSIYSSSQSGEVQKTVGAQGFAPSIYTALINNTSPHPQPLSQGDKGEQDNLSTALSTGEDGLVQVGLYIQGVANLLTSRKLVLVGNNNQILDILTPEQQQKLAKKITWEVASYGYDRRRFFQSQKQSQKIFSQQLPNSQSPRTLLPAKWFWKLMSWVQRGEVAIAANLFQESSLTVINPSNNPPSNLLNNLLKIFSEINFSSLPPLPISPATLQIVDQQVYEIEIKQITPASQWLMQIGEKVLPLIVSPQQVLSRYSGSQSGEAQKNVGAQGFAPSICTTAEQELLYQYQGISNGAVHHLENNPENNPRENIWALIQGAIAYFFGQKSPQEISPDFSPTQSHHQSNYYLNSSIPSVEYPYTNSLSKYQELPFSEDDWLTSEDLFKTIASQEVNDYEDEDMIDLPYTTEIKLLSPTSYPPLTQAMAQKKKRTRLPANNPLIKENIQKKNIQKSTGNNPRAIANKSTYPKPAKSSKPSSKYRDVEYGISNACDISSDLDNSNSGDWIETKVTSKGYVKHPLQKCLEILDNITLWIERLFGRIWRVIKKIVKA